MKGILTQEWRVSPQVLLSFVYQIKVKRFAIGCNNKHLTNAYDCSFHFLFNTITFHTSLSAPKKFVL